MSRILLSLALILVVGVALLFLAGRGQFGEIDGAQTEPAGGPRDASFVRAIEADQRDAARAIEADQRDVARAIAAPDATDAPNAPDAPDAPQILFGDLHVHTTLSSDAFMLNLPMMGGAGAMTPADACDFARHCAALDFWSINDHANSLRPADWRNTIDAIRACNARAGDPANPDTVAFLGWEWTQAGRTPDDHYGHKNVVLAHTDDDRIPARPIAARAQALFLGEASPFLRGALALIDDRFDDLSRRIVRQGDAPVCGEGDVRSLDVDCREVAPTPPELFRKLDEWGHDALVIPHGTAWGIYTPPTSDWSKQLVGAMHDPDRQTLLEVYSGHGDSEVHRDWRAVTTDADGNLVCPEERPGYLPPCRRAGRIVEARCLEEGGAARTCAGRAALARRHAAVAGKDYVATIEGSDAREWLDAGQCRDCAQPSFNYVPTGSAQYIAALGDFSEDPEAPRRFRMGFMASSDNHSARPGTGYKELRAMTDGGFDRPEDASPLASRIRSGGGAGRERPAQSKAIVAGETSPLTALADAERASSFQYTGGLVALHAAARDRASIWDALERRAVYGTSGPRILLWFDLVTASGEHPMGAEVETAEAPTFRVRAVGSREQRPGCPEASAEALGPEALERLCLGECFHPGDARRPIERIEIVRIRPQVHEGEPIGALIDDPWRSLDCAPDPAGCVATFTDDAFPGSERDAVYYARVFEPAKPTVNGTPLDCERDEAGRCLSVSICGEAGDCLSTDRPRAWSSPIYVDHVAARRRR